MLSRIAVCSALVLGTAACVPAAEQPADTMAADLEAVRAVRAQEAAAINAGDVSLTYASADFIMMPPGEPVVSGLEAVTGWMENFTAQFSAELTYTTDSFIVSGDWAIEPYMGNATFTPKDGGEAMRETLKGIHIYHRQGDGSWKMTHDIWNLDAAPPMN